MYGRRAAPPRPSLAAAAGRQPRRDGRPAVASPRPPLAGRSRTSSAASTCRRAVPGSALNDAGVIAAVLNRINTLGPAPGRRSRGELPLVALDHADGARDAAAAIARARRRAPSGRSTWCIADARSAFWVRATDGSEPSGGPAPKSASRRSRPACR